MFQKPVTPADHLHGAVAVAASLAGNLRSSDAIGAATDAELVAMLSDSGALLRHVESLVVAMTAEVHERSSTALIDERLTTRFGCASARELAQRATRASTSTVNRWIRVANAVREPLSPSSGERLPAPLPHLRQALLDGVVGVDAAYTVASALLPSGRRLDPVGLEAADHALARAARGLDASDEMPLDGLEGQGALDADAVADSAGGGAAGVPACAEILKVQAAVWADAIDPDGSEPIETAAMRQRGVTIGVARDGLVSLRGMLLPEVAEQVAVAIDSIATPRHTRVSFRPSDEAAACDLCSDDDCRCADAASADSRSAAQKRHDAFATIVFAAVASADLPTAGGGAPTLVVLADADALASGDGSAYLPRIETHVPLGTALRAACAGAVQRVGMTADGRISHVSSEDRIFNRHQRRAISLRDGNCVIPGCTVPAGWCEIHHVSEWADGGETHTDNGVLLCWFHHRYLDISRWRVRMSDGVPEVQAPNWIDPSGSWRRHTTSRVRLSRRLKKPPDSPIRRT